MIRGGIKNGNEKGVCFNNTGGLDNAKNGSAGSRPISTGNTAARQQEKEGIDDEE
jgi:hypothetical protein